MLWDEQDLQTALFMAEAGGEGRNDPQRSRQKGLAFDMRDFCREEDVCRRDLVLRYFGEEAPDDGGCGRCDNCAAPVGGIVRAEDAMPLTDGERALFVNLKSARRGSGRRWRRRDPDRTRFARHLPQKAGKP